MAAASPHPSTNAGLPSAEPTPQDGEKEAAAIPKRWLKQLRSAWDSELDPSVRRFVLAFGIAVFFAALALARVGTRNARLGAALLLGTLLATLVVRAIVRRRWRKDTVRTIRSTVGKTDPTLSAATLRALNLVHRTQRSETKGSETEGSPALAALHLHRLLSRTPFDLIRTRAAKIATFWSAGGLALGALSLGIVAMEPFRMVEGLDVLLAKNHVAPVPLMWLDDVSMTATPPSYLHEQEELLRPFTPVALPVGSKIAVRGTPLHPGRPLLLTDGHTEVAFVADGEGSAVAHFPLGNSARLQIVAVFGEVHIPQGDVEMITSIPDETPAVRLEGAPRTVRILDEPNLQLAYEASDDHGLREVVLSLRTGTREDRRVLSKPATDARSDKGSHQLGAQDPFFRRTYAPIEARVEARDNDEVTGPKWGKSEALIIVLPQAGEPEALRYKELIKARDLLTDLLNRRLSTKLDAPNPAKTASGQGPSAKPTLAKDVVPLEEEEQEKVRKTTMEALSRSFAGLPPNSRMVALARGQWSRLTKALDAFKKAPSAATYQKLTEQTEDVLLAFDGGVRALGNRDTRTVAKRLADVADEAALAAGALALGMDVESAKVRLDAAFLVLDAGGKQMLGLGDLGLDIGEIVANDLRRIDRARKASDMVHAEFSAQDLAARLRRPDPSFSGGGGGGVESGGSPSVDPGEASDADAEQAANEQELEDLARDHATEMNEVNEALDRAESEEREALREAAREHAQNIREAVKDLPKQGRPDTPEAEAAAGRQEAEGMAGSLDSANLKDAVARGKEALKALREAKRKGGDTGLFEDSTGEKAGKAGNTIEKELAWAEEALEKLQKAARERAKNDLSRSSKDEEKLAERAKQLSEKARKGSRSLDDDTLERLNEAERAMRDAERSLREGEGDKGKKHQETAQRALEMAQGRKDEEGDSKRGEEEDPKSKEVSGKAEIPGKDRYKGPEAFRKRVMDGLSGPMDPALKEAVKRYAEGLLK